jgi:hypothetical protein
VAGDERVPLGEDEAIAILEAIARDESERGSTRARALEEIRARRQAARPAAVQPDESGWVEVPEDDPADELARRRRHVRATGVR